MLYLIFKLNEKLKKYSFVGVVMFYACKTNTPKKEHSSDCLTTQSNSIAEEFISSYILSISEKKGESVASHFVYPISLFNFQFTSEEELSETWGNNVLFQSYMSLDIINEEGVVTGQSHLDNTKFNFTQNEADNNCYQLQFGVGAGMIYTAKMINGKLKIYALDIAG